MNRPAALLLLLVLAAPLVGSALLPGEDQCEAARECDSGGPCDAGCTLGCCTGRTVGLTAEAMNGPPDDLPAPSAPPASIAPISAPPTDILHVPKSA